MMMEYSIFEPILDKKFYSTIASGLLPSGALSAHPTMFINERWSTESEGI
jgi:hypothetical protein